MIVLINTLYFIVMFLLSLISSFCALFMYFPTENRPSNFGRKSRMILLRFCDTRALVRKNISFIRIGLRIYSERQICALQALCCFQFFLFSLSLSLSLSLPLSRVWSNTILFPRIFDFLLRWRALNKTHLLQSEFWHYRM